MSLVKGWTSWAELLKLVGRWDRADRLYVATEGETSPLDVAEVFGMLKREAMAAQHPPDDDHPPPAPQPPGAAGSLGTDLVAVGSMDDLSDFCHCFAVTDAKARSNPEGLLYRGAGLAHLAAFKAATWTCRPTSRCAPAG